MTELDVEIRELRPDALGECLAFFDNDAFVDHPEWAGCYCRFPHADHAGGKWDLDAREANRMAAAAMIERGEMRGYLAYVDGRPVAWCNANLRSSYTIFDADERDPQTIGTIACFAVAKPYRRQGIAGQLLEAACEGFRKAGIGVVEAYPRPDADSAAANHLGPLSMYLAAGFEVVKNEDASVLVRKTL
jgi:GNAT superfamily N-acetyltransferase